MRRAALITVLLCACGPRLHAPGAAIAIKMTPEYVSVAREVAECAGLVNRTQDGGLHWWRVPGDAFRCGRDLWCKGYWEGSRITTRRDIWLAGSAGVGTVRHEILHDLLNVYGQRGHPTPPFGKCAPLVS